MRYGLPYKGSKNAIAEWIVNTLPPAETFVDLFCGGCAVTHYAMLTDKYHNFVINDIDGRLPRLFLDCAHGKYTTKTHPDWISRDVFNQRKGKDAYIALVWSFGNNGKDYLYGADIEELKHAYHQLVFENVRYPISQFGFMIKLIDTDDLHKRYHDYRRQIRTQIKNEKYGKHPFVLNNYSSLENLERLQALENLERLQALERDYRQVSIPDCSLIYCDIPYSSTNCGKYDGFDHAAFYEWAAEQDNIFISEYAMPEPFIEVASIRKSVLSSAKGDSGKVTEKLWTNPKTYERYGAICCDRQLSLF